MAEDVGAAAGVPAVEPRTNPGGGVIVEGDDFHPRRAQQAPHLGRLESRADMAQRRGTGIGERPGQRIDKGNAQDFRGIRADAHDKEHPAGQGPAHRPVGPKMRERGDQEQAFESADM